MDSSFLTIEEIATPQKKSYSLVVIVYHSKKDPIYVFPEMKLHGLVPNFHIHVSESNSFIPTIGPPILLQKIGGPIVVGIYKLLTEP